jgi:3-deoxy-manno-octulosonate cytidylyltransferase (CMP-KDO synthetase)
VADAVVVATDSQEIADVVADAGGRTVLTSDQHPSGTDRAAEVIQRPEFAGYDIVLNVQGDEPFISDAVVRGALSMVRDRGFPLGTAAVRAPEAICDTPHVVKVVCADNGCALYFSRAPIPWLRDTVDRAERQDLVRQHVGVYAYTREALVQWVALDPHPLERVERLEQLRPLAAGMRMGVALVDTPPPGGIDTEEDLARANALWVDLYAGRT